MSNRFNQPPISLSRRSAHEVDARLLNPPPPPSRRPVQQTPAYINPRGNTYDPRGQIVPDRRQWTESPRNTSVQQANTADKHFERDRREKLAAEQRRKDALRRWQETDEDNLGSRLSQARSNLQTAANLWSGGFGSSSAGTKRPHSPDKGSAQSKSLKK